MRNAAQAVPIVCAMDLKSPFHVRRNASRVYTGLHNLLCVEFWRRGAQRSLAPVPCLEFSQRGSFRERDPLLKRLKDDLALGGPRPTLSCSIARGAHISPTVFHARFRGALGAGLHLMSNLSMCFLPFKRLEDDLAPGGSRQNASNSALHEKFSLSRLEDDLALGGSRLRDDVTMCVCGGVEGHDLADHGHERAA